MRTSPQGIAEIAGHEGIVLSPYRDSVGVWTFGIGHTAAAGPPDPLSFPKGEKQPLARALDIFRADLRAVEQRVNAAVKVPVAQHEFDALVSFDFNTGGINRARLVDLLNAGDRAGAAAAFDGWHRPPEIIERRNREKRLFRDGTYANGGMATVWSANANGRVSYSNGERVNVLDLLAPAPRPQPDDPGEDGDGLSWPETTGHPGRKLLLGAALIGLTVAAWKLKDRIGPGLRKAWQIVRSGSARERVVLGLGAVAVLALVAAAFSWAF